MAENRRVRKGVGGGTEDLMLSGICCPLDFCFGKYTEYITPKKNIQNYLL